MSDLELDGYFRFTGPARLSRAMHSLEGLLLGIVIDHKINDQELLLLANWVAANEDFADRHPFNELIPILNAALADREISEEERADLLWCCGKFTSADGFYGDATANMQRLQSILAGVIADGVVTDQEAMNLSAWMKARQDLKTVWPYAELDAVLTHVLSDGVIDEKEQKLLLDLFKEFSEISQSPQKPKQSIGRVTVTGICACDPEIIVPDRLFCFTGESERWTRSQFQELITQRGGRFHTRVTKDIHYLVVGGGGNQCWAYSCYGRKVEAAANLRMKGESLLIVHEYDVWDVVQ